MLNSDRLSEEMPSFSEILFENFFLFHCNKGRMDNGSRQTKPLRFCGDRERERQRNRAPMVTQCQSGFPEFTRKAKSGRTLMISSISFIKSDFDIIIAFLGAASGGTLDFMYTGIFRFQFNCFLQSGSFASTYILRMSGCQKQAKLTFPPPSSFSFAEVLSNKILCNF